MIKAANTINENKSEEKVKQSGLIKVGAKKVVKFLGHNVVVFEVEMIQDEDLYARRRAVDPGGGVVMQIL